MDGIAAPPPDGAGEQESSPALELDGYSGTLEHLLALARAHRIDLARLPLLDLCDKLGAAMQRTSSVPLGRRSQWLVTAAWLLQLRSRLMVVADAHIVAAEAAKQGWQGGERAGLQETQALAAWLERRPQLGHAVFARGRPEWVGTIGDTEHEVDVIEFLWASMALFDADLPAAETAARYRPVWLDLHGVPDARERIRRLMAGRPEGAALSWLLPAPEPDAVPSRLKQRSAWTSTFVASLELAKQGNVELTQEHLFAPIHVALRSDSP